RGALSAFLQSVKIKLQFSGPSCREIWQWAERNTWPQDRMCLCSRTRATIGHATAAPPSSVMNSRRFIRSPRRRGGGQDFGFANPRQPRFASPVRVRPNSARGGTVFGANEAQVADDFVAAAMVRRMIDAVDHGHVGKIKRAHAL